MQAESLSHGDANPLQRTAKWFSDRCGCLTASRAADALAISAKTGKPLKSRQDLIDQAEDFFPSEGKGLKESGNARQ